MNKITIKEVIKNLINRTNNCKLSLFNGIIGDTLLLYEIYSLSNNFLLKEHCYQNINIIKANIENCNSLNFCDGLAGILFMFSYLENKDFIQTEQNFYDDFDEYFETYIDVLTIKNNYYLLYRIIGIGIYYLEVTKQHADKKRILQKIINNLLSLSIDFKGIKYWRYTLEANYNFKDKEVINLGMLHGMPSIIAFSLICIKRKYVNNETKIEIYKVLNFLINSFWPHSNNYTYPNFVCICNNKIVKDEQISRLGYCYGDLSVINLFYLAYCVYRENKLKKHAEHMFEKISDRVSNLNEFDDPFFCHGYASLYYFINKFNGCLNLSNDNKKQNQTLSVSLKEKMLENSEWKNTGIIDGYSGVFLSLLSKNKNNFLENILLLNIL